ncbi:DUF726 domain-containing protein [Photobacterium swingsii]|uniref:DUF726 domain-containing protein n=1 Tax=Photobacterium swingsii TaxID=680026 RepID=UPI0040691DEF
MLSKLKAIKAALPRVNPTQPTSDPSSAVELHVIREGKHKSASSAATVLVINGFMSGKGCDVSDWLEVVDALYPDHKVIHVKWKAGNLSDLLLDEGLVQLMPSVTTQDSLIKKLGVAGFSAINKVSGHWRKAFAETEVVGAALANLIEQDPELDACVLMGHSLGARIIRHTMERLTTNKVSQCYLLAGAVSSHSKLWKTIFDTHADTVFINCMSKTDSVLKYAYKAGTLFRESPIGLHALEHKSHTAITNLDVTDVASKHTKFKHKALGEVLKEVLMKPTPAK